MLDGLDDVPWATLSHAYGEASDVPKILRAIASGDNGPIDDLFGNIWHQGTVYEATAPAVPFLYALVEAPGVKATSLLYLLRLIADGSSYHDVHQDLLPRSQQNSPEMLARIDDELAHVRAAYDAVLGGIPRLVHWLSEGPEDVREASAHVLASCGARRDVFADALRATVSTDPSDLVRAAALLALRNVGADVATLLPSMLAREAPLARLVAAMVGARTEGLDDRLVTVIERDGPRARGVLRDLSDAIDSSDPMTYVLEALDADWRAQARVVSTWLSDEDPEVSEGAAFASETIIETWRGSENVMTPPLAKAIADPRPKVAYWAARNLGVCAFGNPEAIGPLWSRVEGASLAEHNTPEAFAFTALIKLGDPRATRRLLEGLTEGPPQERPTFHRHLEHLDPEMPGLFETLLAIFDDITDGNSRIAALGKLGRPHALPLLRRELLRHPHQVTRVLGDLGPAAVSAVDELRALEHDSAVVNNNVARALWTIAGDPTGLGRLVSAVDGDDAYGATHALELLVGLAPLGADLGGLEPLLPKLLDSDHDWMRLRAAHAHVAWCRDPEPVLGVLESYVGGSLYGRSALELATRVGPPARSLVPRIRALLDSPTRVARARHGENALEADLAVVRVCEAALAAIMPT